MQVSTVDLSREWPGPARIAQYHLFDLTLNDESSLSGELVPFRKSSTINAGAGAGAAGVLDLRRRDARRRFGPVRQKVHLCKVSLDPSDE